MKAVKDRSASLSWRLAVAAHGLLYFHDAMHCTLPGATGRDCRFRSMAAEGFQARQCHLHHTTWNNEGLIIQFKLRAGDSQLL